MKPQSTANFFQVPPVLLFGVAYLMALVLSVFICISIYNQYNEKEFVAKKATTENNELISTASIINK